MLMMLAALTEAGRRQYISPLAALQRQQRPINSAVPEIKRYTCPRLSVSTVKSYISSVALAILPPSSAL